VLTGSPVNMQFYTRPVEGETFIRDYKCRPRNCLQSMPTDFLGADTLELSAASLSSTIIMCVLLAAATHTEEAASLSTYRPSVCNCSCLPPPAPSVW
jgi:hypothetical protein